MKRHLLKHYNFSTQQLKTKNKTYNQTRISVPREVVELFNNSSFALYVHDNGFSFIKSGAEVSWQIQKQMTSGSVS